MSDDNSSERYNPHFAHCGSLTLSFDGRWLELRGGRVPKVYRAVSGRALEGVEPRQFDYAPERQRISHVGPIPEGSYWIRPDELWTNAWYRRGAYAGWGNYRISIHPFSTTETFGRSGFFIHGGRIPGSAGCIDLTSAMDTFVRDLERAVGSNTRCQIHLRVRYVIQRVAR